MRTGSTLVSELLTHPPKSFIFREPHIGKNDFQLKPGDQEEILSHFDVHLANMLKGRRAFAFLQRRLRFFNYRQDYMVRFLKHSVQPRLNNGKAQIGVKEINNVGWQNYHRHFPNMKTILLGRDPRDIYLSMVYRRQNEGAYKKYNLDDPRSIATVLNNQFQLQMDICQVTDSLPVKYEVLCSQSHIREKILTFVESPLTAPEEVGQFLRKHPQLRGLLF